MTLTYTLADVVNDPFVFKYSDALYMAPNAPFDLDIPVLVHDINDVDGDADLPKIALDLGYDYVLTMQTIQSIVANARAQNPNATPDDLIDALSYYYDNDAFINWRK